ncbi:FlgD immunoglobulin-like domain containing protein, partial [candidate division CSSED10-310 bacterium]
SELALIAHGDCSTPDRIMALNLELDTQRTITAAGSNRTIYKTAAWSPVSAELVYEFATQERDCPNGAGIGIEQDKGPGIWVVRADGAHKDQLLSSFSLLYPQFSPRGATIAYFHDQTDPLAADGTGRDLWMFRNRANCTATITNVAENGNVLSINGTANDLNFDYFEINAALGAYSDLFNISIVEHADTPVINSLLAQWAPPDSGIYRIRLTVYDKAGNQVQTEKIVNFVLQTSSILSAHCEPVLFSPGYDGINDTTTLFFETTAPGSADLKIINNLGIIIYQDTITYTNQGQHSYIWDGLNGQVPFSDGDYVMMLDTGLPGDLVATANVVIDTSPPETLIDVRKAFAFVSVTPEERSGLDSGFVNALDLLVNIPRPSRDQYVNPGDGVFYLIVLKGAQGQWLEMRGTDSGNGFIEWETRAQDEMFFQWVNEYDELVTVYYEYSDTIVTQPHPVLTRRYDQGAWVAVEDCAFGLDCPGMTTCYIVNATGFGCLHAWPVPEIDVYGLVQDVNFKEWTLGYSETAADLSPIVLDTSEQELYLVDTAGDRLPQSIIRLDALSWTAVPYYFSLTAQDKAGNVFRSEEQQPWNELDFHHLGIISHPYAPVEEAFDMFLYGFEIIPGQLTNVRLEFYNVTTQSGWYEVPEADMLHLLVNGYYGEYFRFSLNSAYFIDDIVNILIGSANPPGSLTYRARFVAENNLGETVYSNVKSFSFGCLEETCYEINFYYSDPPWNYVWEDLHLVGNPTDWYELWCDIVKIEGDSVPLNNVLFSPSFYNNVVGQTIPVYARVMHQGTAIPDDAQITSVTLYYREDNDGQWQNFAMTPYHPAEAVYIPNNNIVGLIQQSIPPENAWLIDWNTTTDEFPDGPYYLKAVATDNYGNQAVSQGHWYRPEDPIVVVDNTPPEAAITYPPHEFYTVDNPICFDSSGIPVFGTVTDEHLIKWWLQYSLASGSSSPWVTIVVNDPPTQGNPGVTPAAELCHFHPGDYEIQDTTVNVRLIGRDFAGNQTISDQVSFYIGSYLHLRNFRLNPNQDTRDGWISSTTQSVSRLKASLQYELNQTANMQLMVYSVDPQEEKYDVAFTQTVPPQLCSYTLDPTDAGLLEGIYHVFLSAEDPHCGGIVETWLSEGDVRATIYVDNTPPIANLSPINLEINPTEVEVRGQACDCDSTAVISQMGHYKIEYQNAANPDFWQTLVLPANNLPAEDPDTLLYLWNLEELDEGIYTVRLHVQDHVGNEAEHTQTFELVRLGDLVGTFTATPNLFSNSSQPGTVDHTTITYQILRDNVDVTLEVLDQGGQFVQELDLIAGIDSLDWDGIDGSPLPEGVYSIRITVVVPQHDNYTWEETIPEVEIDSTAPVSAFNNPNESNKADAFWGATNIPVRISVDDVRDHLAGYEVEYALSPDPDDPTPPDNWPPLYTGDNIECNNTLILNWNVSTPEFDTYVALRIRSWDEAGNQSTVSIEEIDLRPHYQFDPNLSFSPEILSPESANTYYRTTTIFYTIDDPVEVTLEIPRIGLESIELISSTVMQPGSHQATWDGRDNNDLLAPSGLYTVKITAYSPFLIVPEHTVIYEIPGLLLDRDYPVVQITSPEEDNAIVSGLVTITGNAYDSGPDPAATFDNYLVEVKAESASQWEIIAQSATPVTNGTLGTWNSHSQEQDTGVYQIRLTALDQGGLESSTIRTVTVVNNLIQDFQADLPVFSPNSDTFFDQLTMTYNYVGDASISDISVQIHACGDGHQEILIYSDTPTTGVNTVFWDEEDTPEGFYILRLTATITSSGYQEIETTTVTVDTKPPLVQITNPVSYSAYENYSSLDISGMIQDEANSLLSYQLEYAPVAGDPNEDDYIPIGLVTESGNVNGVLYTWEIPTDVIVAAFRLTAWDSVHNTSDPTVVSNVEFTHSGDFAPNLDFDPDLFAADLGQQTGISFNQSYSVTKKIRLEILDAAGDSITLVDGPYTPNSYIEPWNGYIDPDTMAEMAPSGNYSVKIIAYPVDQPEPGPNDPFVIKPGLKLDNDAPVVEILTPSASDILGVQVTITGNLHDPPDNIPQSLKEYQLLITDSDNEDIVVLLEETIGPAMLYLWDTTDREDGSYDISLTAKDKVGHDSNTAATVRVTISNDRLQDVDAQPGIFSCSQALGQSTTISYNLIQPLDVRITITGPGIDIPLIDPPHNNGLNSIPWNGRDDGVSFPDVQYLITVEAYNDQFFYSETETTFVDVDSTPPQIQFTSPDPPALIRGNVDVRIQITDPHADSYTLEQAFYKPGDPQSSWIWADVASGAVVGDVVTYSWDSSNLDTYTAFRCTATDIPGNENSAELIDLHPVYTFEPDITLNNTYFSPNGDGILDTTTISYTVTDPMVEITVQILDDQDEVKTWTYSSVLPDTYHLQWDGYASGVDPATDDPAADGAYSVKITATSPFFDPPPANNQLSEQLDGLVLDTQPPVLDISQPAPGEMLSDIVYVTGSVMDQPDTTVPSFGLFTLRVSGDNYGPLEIGTGNSEKDNEILGEWNTVSPEELIGTFTLELEAQDLAGNKNIITRQVSCDNDRIKNFSVNPNLISPRESLGIADFALISFDLTDDIQTIIEVFNDNWSIELDDGTTIRLSGHHEVPWDALAEPPLADGPYIVRITAFISDTYAEVEQALVFIDDTYPEVAIETMNDIVPIPDMVFDTTNVTITITGQISDDHPKMFDIALKQSGDFFTIRSETNTSLPSGSLLSTLIGLNDGHYTLKIHAEDKTDIVSEIEQTFFIDTAPPSVAITSPQDGLLLGSGQGQLEIRGTIIESNLQHYLLEYSLDDENFTRITQGTSTGQDISLALWDITALGDDDYEIRLTALDVAGLTDQDSITISIDSTAPNVALTPFVIGDPGITPAVSDNSPLINDTVDITGTATDIHFQKYILSYALISDGALGTFGTLAESTDPVTDSVLFTWQNLPPDGEYRLQLTGLDTFGHQSVTTLDVIIIRAPPNAPGALTVTQDCREGIYRDVTLEWNPSTSFGVIGYYIYRNDQPITAQYIPSTNFMETLSADGTYTYTVKALNDADLTSDASEPVSVTFDCSPPQAVIVKPQDNEYVGSSGTPIIGTAYSEDDFEQYTISIIDDQNIDTDIKNSVLAVAFGELATWNVDTFDQGAYTIRLTVSDVNGNTGSVEKNVILDKEAPTGQVIDLTATVNFNTVELNWQVEDDPAIFGFLIYRDGDLANAPFPPPDDLSPYVIHELTYIDSGVADGDHYYWVVPVDIALNGGTTSNVVSVTIDTEPPTASLVYPGDRSIIPAGEVLVTGTINDLHLDNYTLSICQGYPQSGTFTVLVDEDNPQAGDEVIELGSIADLLPGINTLKLEVLDQATNQTVVFCTFLATTVLDLTTTFEPETCLNQSPLTIEGQTEPLAEVLLHASDPALKSEIRGTITVDSGSVTPEDTRLFLYLQDPLTFPLTQPVLSATVFFDDGEFHLTDVAPGEYYVIAVKDTDDDGLYDFYGYYDPDGLGITSIIVTSDVITYDVDITIYQQPPPPPGLNFQVVNSVLADITGVFSFTDVPVTEGTNVFYLKARNIFGSQSETLYLPIVIDTVPPEISIQTSGAGDTACFSQTDLALEIAITDPNLEGHTVSLDGLVLEIDGQPQEPTVSVEPIADGYVVYYSISGEGDYQLDISASDCANTINTSSTICLDITPPQIEAPAEGTCFSSALTSVCEVIEPHLDIVEVALLKDGDPVQDFQCGDPLTEDGDYALEITATDTARNSAQISTTFVIDTTIPLVTWQDAINNYQQITDGALFALPVEPIPIVTELHLESENYYYRYEAGDPLEFLPGTVLSASGNYQLLAEASDCAGWTNTTTAQLSFIIDQEAPQITISEPVPDGTYCQPVQPLVSVFDAIDPAPQVSATLNGGPFTLGSIITADGFYTLTVEALDAAGNTSRQSINFTIISSTPELSIDYPGDGHYYNNDILPRISVNSPYPVTIAAALNGSAYDLNQPITAEGEYTLTVSVSINSAVCPNQNSASVHFWIDKTPPVITLTGVEAGFCYAEPVTITFAFTDDFLDAASVVSTLDGTPVESGVDLDCSAKGNHSLSLLAQDLAGNQSDPAYANITFSLNCDFPLLEIAVSTPDILPDTFYNTSSVTFTVTVTDDDPTAVDNLNLTLYTPQNPEGRPYQNESAVDLCPEGAVTPYQVHLDAETHNSCGNSTTEQAFITVVATPLDPPENLNGADNGDGSVLLTWDPVSGVMTKSASSPPQNPGDAPYTDPDAAEKVPVPDPAYDEDARNLPEPEPDPPADGAAGEGPMWSLIQQLPMGNFHDMCYFDPDVIVTAVNRPHYSTDDGQTWNPNGPNTELVGHLSDPINGYIYGSYQGVGCLRSSTGTSWQGTALDTWSFQYHDFAQWLGPDGPGLSNGDIIAGRDNSGWLYYSSDEGVNWTKLVKGQSWVNFNYCIFFWNDYLYAGGPGKGIMRSNTPWDADSWKPISEGGQSPGGTFSVNDYYVHQNLLWAACNYESRIMYSSNGLDWTEIDLSSVANGVGLIANGIYEFNNKLFCFGGAYSGQEFGGFVVSSSDPTNPDSWTLEYLRFKIAVGYNNFNVLSMTQNPQGTELFFTNLIGHVYKRATPGPKDLQTEGQTNPTNVRDFTPEFDFLIDYPDLNDFATFYWIQVNAQADMNGILMWDTGKTEFPDPVQAGTRCIPIEYDGLVLESGLTYYWRVKVWDDEDVAGPFSASNDYFQMTEFADILGYFVYMSTDGGNSYTRLNQTVIPQPDAISVNYISPQLSAGDYCFVVTQVDYCYNESPYSASYCLTISDILPPEPPVLYPLPDPTNVQTMDIPGIAELGTTVNLSRDIEDGSGFIPWSTASTGEWLFAPVQSLHYPLLPTDCVLYSPSPDQNNPVYGEFMAPYQFGGQVYTHFLMSGSGWVRLLSEYDLITYEMILQSVTPLSRAEILAMEPQGTFLFIGTDHFGYDPGSTADFYGYAQYPAQDNITVFYYQAANVMETGDSERMNRFEAIVYPDGRIMLSYGQLGFINSTFGYETGIYFGPLNYQVSGPALATVQITTPQAYGFGNVLFDNVSLDFGVNHFRATASDPSGNESLDSDTVTTHLLDAPSVTILFPEECQVYDTPVTPIYEWFDAADNITVQQVTLNGDSITLDFTISGDGDYTLVAYVEDANGYNDTDTVHFAVDILPPDIEVTKVEDGQPLLDQSLLNIPVIPLISINDPGGLVSTLVHRDSIPVQCGTTDDNSTVSYLFDPVERMMSLYTPENSASLESTSYYGFQFQTTAAGQIISLGRYGTALGTVYVTDSAGTILGSVTIDAEQDQKVELPAPLTLTIGELYHVVFQPLNNSAHQPLLVGPAPTAAGPVEINSGFVSPDLNFPASFSVSPYTLYGIPTIVFEPSTAVSCSSYSTLCHWTHSSQTTQDTFDRDGRYSVDVTVTDLGNNTAQQTIMFEVDRTPPTVEFFNNYYDDTPILDGTIYLGQLMVELRVHDFNLDQITLTANNEPVELNFQGNFQQHLDFDRIYLSEPLTEEGAVELILTVTDLAGYETIIIRDVEISPDNEPTQIVISGVTAETCYNVPVIPLIEVTDNNLDYYTIFLDGKDFSSGTELTCADQGRHRLEVVAYDMIGNQTYQAVDFTIDCSPPSIDVVFLPSQLGRPFFHHEQVSFYIVVQDNLSPEAEIISSALLFTPSFPNGIPYQSEEIVDLCQENQGSADFEITLSVEASDQCGNPHTESLTVTVQIDPPLAPADLAGQSDADSHVQLTWSQVPSIQGETYSSDNCSPTVSAENYPWVENTPQPGALIIPDHFQTLEEALDQAQDGGSIFVRAGNYYSTLQINKHVSLLGENPRTTVIHGKVTIAAAADNAPNTLTIDGFTFTNVLDSQVLTLQDSPLSTISINNCIFNLEYFRDAALLSVNDVSYLSLERCLFYAQSFECHFELIDSLTIRNCSFVGLDLEFTDNHSAAIVQDIGNLFFINNIVANFPYGIYNQGQVLNSRIAYNLFWQTDEYTVDLNLDEGNIYENPYFTAAGINDYTLLPDSGAINAGDPFYGEHPLSGNRYDIGVYEYLGCQETTAVTMPAHTIAGYNVYIRPSSQGTFSQLNATLIPQPYDPAIQVNYETGPLTDDVMFCFAVTSVDSCSVESQLSSEHCVPVPDGIPPRAPGCYHHQSPTAYTRVHLWALAEPFSRTEIERLDDISGTWSVVKDAQAGDYQIRQVSELYHNSDPPDDWSNLHETLTDVLPFAVSFAPPPLGKTFDSFVQYPGGWVCLLAADDPEPDLDPLTAANMEYLSQEIPENTFLIGLAGDFSFYGAGDESFGYKETVDPLSNQAVLVFFWNIALELDPTGTVNRFQIALYEDGRLTWAVETLTAEPCPDLLTTGLYLGESGETVLGAAVTDYAETLPVTFGLVNTFFPNISLDPGMNNFRAMSKDSEANMSETSNVVTIERVQEPHPPLWEYVLAGDAEVFLAWLPNAEPDIVGYFLWRQGPGDAEPVQLNTVPLTELQYHDAGLTNGQPYTYWLQAERDLLDLVSQFSPPRTVIPGGPDLKITASDLSINPAVCKEGELVTLQAEVHNVGPQPAFNVALTFFAETDSGTSVQLGSTEIPEMAPDMSQTVEISFNTTDLVGTPLLSVLVDPYNTISELNETNNTAYIGLTVLPNTSQTFSFLIDLGFIPDGESRFDIDNPVPIWVNIQNVGDLVDAAVQVRIKDSGDHVLTVLDHFEVIAWPAGSVQYLTYDWDCGM